MTENTSRVDSFRALLVLAATIGMIAFNWLAAVGRINGVTPGEISNKYSTLITPADYAFTIWILIYAGLIAFGIYQLLPANVTKYRNIRSPYILSCALNCGWIYMWYNDQVTICFVILVLLWASLLLIGLNLKKTESTGAYWFAKAPFEIYFGWVSVAALVNFAILLLNWNTFASESGWTVVSVVLILSAAALAVLVRMRLGHYLTPLAIAWGLAAVGVKQSGHTLIVVACAVGLVSGLIASLSFVLNLPSSESRLSAEDRSK